MDSSREEERDVRTVIEKVAWVGRATVFCVGLAVVLAAMLGVATTALAAAPGDPFRLGKINTVNAITQLVGGRAGAMLLVDNNSKAPSARAIDLRVEPGRTPMTVNADAGKALNLNADKLDDRDTGDFVTRGQASSVPSGVFVSPLNFHSYFMDTSAVRDYPFGQMKLQTTGVPGQFRVCGNGTPGTTSIFNFVVYVNGARTAGSFNAGGACSAVFDAGAGGEFQVSARRAQIFGVHSGDGTTNENYSLIGFDQLG